MLTLKGFHLSEKVYESKKSVVYRAVRESDKLPVMVKSLKAKRPTREELDLFEYEYRIVSELDLPGVIKTLSLENVGRSKAVIMEGFGAISLGDYIRNQPIDLDSFLPIAIALTDIIGTIHERNIIHKGITPQNILINPETKEVKITDFGIATRVHGEASPALDQGVIEGSLAYISPEQTGRMKPLIWVIYPEIQPAMRLLIKGLSRAQTRNIVVR